MSIEQHCQSLYLYPSFTKIPIYHGKRTHGWTPFFISGIFACSYPTLFCYQGSQSPGILEVLCFFQAYSYSAWPSPATLLN
jgi:hypothetical protein